MERAFWSRLHWFVFEFFIEMLGITNSWRGHDTLLFPKETRKEDMTTFQPFCWSKVSFYSHICLCSFSSSSSKHVFFLLREKSTETYSPWHINKGAEVEPISREDTYSSHDFITTMLSVSTPSWSSSIPNCLTSFQKLLICWMHWPLYVLPNIFVFL